MGRHFPYFKAYDIRGTTPDQVTPQVAYRAARALVEWSKADQVIIGRDARLTSPALAEAAIDGLIDSGVTVRDLGLVSTPMLNFAVARQRRHGLMITASHNPGEYNGIKLIDPHVEQIYYGRGLEAIESLVAANRFEEPRRRGRVVLASVLHDYQDHLFEVFRASGLSALSVVIDCSSGVGGLPLGVLDRLGIAHTLLHHVPDGHFPHHGCDTLRPENLAELQRAVTAHGTALGLMFDGDADRVVFVDEQGAIAPIDQIFVLLARQALKGIRGRIFYDLRFSRSVKEEIERAGGTPVMMRVGNPFHKEALHRHDDGLLAAELSGHIMYREHFGIDDALFAALKLMSVLAQGRQRLSALLQPLRRYAGSGELRIRTDEPERVVGAIRAQFADGSVTEIDGVTIDFPDWWVNVRPSNTEPVVKLVMEATTAELLAHRMADVRGAILRAGGALEERQA